MNRRIALPIPIIAVLLLAGCTAEVENSIVLRPVSTTEVVYGRPNSVRAFSGTAMTDKTINLSFRGSGIVTRFDVNVGATVRRGQLLAQLDNVQARLAFEQAQTGLSSAESQMNTARLAYDRVRSLYEQGSASLSEFESARNAYRTAENSYESAKRSVSIQEEQVRYGYIYAPESGTIASVFAELDENVGAGQTVAVLNAGILLEVALGLPESVINDVRQGQNVTVSFPAIPGESFSGTVTEVSPSIDPQTSTFPVRVRVDDVTERARAGMSASVRFDFGGPPDGASGLLVPAKAVGEDADGRFVFVVERGPDGGTARKARVTTGGFSSAGFEITEGLVEGQLVVTAGLQTLLDGQRVRTGGEATSYQENH